MDKLLELYTKLIDNLQSSEIVMKLNNYLLTTDIITAPASTRFHHSYEGGLLEHCLEVFKYIKDVNTLYPEIELSEEVRFVLAFGHDISKTNFYVKEYKNKKIHGEWRSIEAYAVDDKLHLPHEIASIHLLKKLFPIDINIEKAILYHHGAFNQATSQEFSESCAKDDYTFILHTADMISSKRNERFKLPKIQTARGW